jgi:hypothetical protein
VRDAASHRQLWWSDAMKAVLFRSRESGKPIDST